MREGWKEVELREITDVINGFAFKSKDFVESGIPLIKIKEIKENRINLSACSFLPSNFKLNEKFTVKKGDVIIALTGSHITLPSSAVGRVAMSYIDDVLFLNQRVGKFKVDENKADLNYLYFFLSSEYFFNSVGLMAKGAANQANISGDDIKSLKINLPPLETQRKIASILSGYDDLIENNLKRIKILEEMAQQTYEEWFVRMRFPGYETEVMNEETGLPEVWEKVKLGDLCDKIFDGTHDSPKQSEFGYKLITGKHLQKGKVDFETAYFISEEDHFKIKKRSELTKGDIMYSNIGTIGNLSMVYEDFEYSCKNMIVFRPKHNLQYFVYTYLFNENTKNKIIGEASGSTQKFISLGYIRNYEDYFPSLNFITDFSEYCNPIYKKINNLNKQNQRLREARDLLLPRLMMGIVEV